MKKMILFISLITFVALGSFAVAARGNRFWVSPKSKPIRKTIIALKKNMVLGLSWPVHFQVKELKKMPMNLSSN